MGNVVCFLQFQMLVLELIEILALLREYGSLGGVACGDRFDHALVEGGHETVEGLTALLLASLALQEHCLGKLTTDLNDGVQRGHGILEDHGDLIAADLVELVLGDLQKILTVVDDLAVLHDGVTGQNTQNCFGSDRLTRTGFAYDSQGLALGQVEADTADSLYLTIGGTEGDGQIIYMKLVFLIVHYPSTPLVAGLNASLSPLPKRLKEIRSRDKKIAGNSMAWGAESMAPWP